MAKQDYWFSETKKYATNEDIEESIRRNEASEKAEQLRLSQKSFSNKEIEKIIDLHL